MRRKTMNIKYRLVAFTDAAGKYASDAPRSGNEDNFYIDDNLSDDVTNKADQNEAIELSKKGMLMVVADGMGGMNAGEIASQIAVDTIKEFFVQDKLTEDITKDSDSRRKYIEKAIKAADNSIKCHSKENVAYEGMGSTIIVGWLFNNELTISWCGDSRAYLYNDKAGIRLLSRDHSYVQELVNKGLLTYDQTFDHPQNNIVTRSLGDPTKEAHPESKTVKIGRGDIILLCSDGLSGALRDRKTYDSNGQLYPEGCIEDIIRANTSSMKECREALWASAEKSGWYDNVTAILCQILEGPESPNIIQTNVSQPQPTKKWTKALIALLLTIIMVLASLCAYLFFKKPHPKQSEPSMGISLDDSLTIDRDSIKTEIIQEEHAPLVPKMPKETIDYSKSEPKKSITSKIEEQNEKKEKDTHSEGLTEIEDVGMPDASALTPIDNSLRQKKDMPQNPNKKEY